MTTIATLAGCAIGDALGVPFEMKNANNPLLKQWDGLFKDGSGYHRNSKAGQFSDDTQMTVALANSLVQCNGFKPEDVAQKYLAWYQSGDCRGIGSTTAGALMQLKMGRSHTESGATHSPGGRTADGNGTAMRASPIGLAYRNAPLKLMDIAASDAIITHNSKEAKVGSIAVALAVAMLANRNAKPQSVAWAITEILPSSKVKDKILRAQYWMEQGTPLDTIAAEALADIGTSGYVPETVGAAFFCLGATNNFKDCVMMAVKGGGDADTTAAIAGALAGSWYGLEGIPEEYHSVEDFDLLNDLTNQLLDLKVS